MQPSVIKHSVLPEEIARKATLGKAIEYCAEIAGYSYDKTLEHALEKAGVKIDKTQLSRWQSGAEGIKWEKLEAIMNVCGNDAPLMWMVHQMGYDLHSLRERESEIERENRLLREERDALLRLLTGRQ